MWWIPSSVGVVFLAFIAIILFRTISFRPPKETVKTSTVITSVNKEKAARDLAEMIKCKTISSVDKSLEKNEEFEKFERILPELFPNVYKKCEFSKLGDRSLLFRWRGHKHDEPTVLMSHYDVVEVDEEKWEKPPFDGIIENGVLWGRGTLDTKGTLNAILQAAESLISEGFVPARDIYFAFGGDEEINGTGAIKIVEYFKQNNIIPGVVLDEGGAVATNVFPGVKTPCALIGIAEKGVINVEYSVEGGGGHASSPAPRTPIGRLSKACLKVEDGRFKFRLTKPTAELFDTVGRHSTFLYRMLFANLWCFKPILALYARLTGGEMNAVVRTTVAFTQMQGSNGANVIPTYSKMVSNHRIIPGETAKDVEEHIKKLVADPKVNIRSLCAVDPSRISDTSCEAWDRVKSTVAETWQEAIVTPYLMVACSDSRNWGVISDKVYRFSAMSLSKEERGTIHGNNERIPLETIAKTVEFYIRLMKKS